MKAVFFDRQGSLDHLRYDDLPDPSPAPDEVVIKVEAAALNGFEPMMVLGTTELKTPLPMIPSGDAAGRIVDIGPQARGSNWRIGDRVLIEPFFGSKMMGETAPGGACGYVACTPDRLIRIPDSVSMTEAACTQIAYGTAHRMMHVRGQVRGGETIIIMGATGGVGVACVQFAKLAGLEITACGGSAWKCERLAALGADHVIDTSREDWMETVTAVHGRARVSGIGGVDVVVDYIGGKGFMSSLKLLKRGGRMLVCGATAGYDASLDLRYLWSFERMIVGADGWERSDSEAVLAMMADKRLSPIIDSVRPFSQGPQAVRDLYERRIFGKVVLVPEEASAASAAA